MISLLGENESQSAYLLLDLAFFPQKGLAINNQTESVCTVINIQKKLQLWMFLPWLLTTQVEYKTVVFLNNRNLFIFLIKTVHV